MNYYVTVNANLAFHNHYNTTSATWFLDMGVNQCVTHDFMNMTNLESYLGIGQLHVGDGKGLSISNVAHSIIRTPKHTFTVSNILHLSHIKKPLLFVHKLYVENKGFFEFHSFVFYIKDLLTKKVFFSY